MKTAVTLAVLVFMSTIPVSDARRGQKLVESLEMKQGYLGWGLPALDFTLNEEYESAPKNQDPSLEIKNVRRTPKQPKSDDKDKIAPAFGLGTSDHHFTASELLEMSDGLE